MYAIRTVGPLLIQNASEHPDFCDHSAVRFGLNRYLGVPIHDLHGKPIGTLCFLFLDNRVDTPLGEEDIRFLSLLAMRVSAEVERERMVQSRMEEHQVMADNLAELNARLEATAEAKRRFVATVLHDLRHPITAMRTLLFVLRDEQDPQERQTCIDLLENRLGVLAELLDALMQYHEIEAGHTRLNVEQVDLGRLITECVEEFAPASVSQEVHFVKETEPNLGEARTDVNMLRHVIANLLSNALKFTPRGTVWVRARRRGAKRWALEVEDTGIGMSEEDQRQVFQEFYRAETAYAQGSGAGLGLAIVKQLCGALQGTVELKSVPDEGTLFRITFPRDLK